MELLDAQTSPGAFLHGERLVLRTVRLLAFDVPCPGLKTQFVDACGCAGIDAYCGLAAFVAQLRLIGRRSVALGAPLAGLITEDEMLILQAFACAQADDRPGLARRLASLAAGEPPLSLAAAVCLSAQILAMNGLIVRRSGLPGSCACRGRAARVATVH